MSVTPNDFDSVPKGRLCILETTDLHMQILPYDYFADHEDDTMGLARLADKITALRADPAVTTLLFDNGDFLQGTPLADHVASTWHSGRVHPMIAAMNVLKYDAITLGNHEFDYGIPFLESVLEQVEFPVVCANLELTDHAPIAEPFQILKRPILCNDGISRDIHIGLIGFLPPQVPDWNPDLCDGLVKTTDIIERARALIPQIQAAGADIIIALCHAGIGSAIHSHEMENAVVPLAAIAGIDVILAGHTHEFFPDPTRTGTDAIDPVLGRIHGKPTVMAGFFGSRLGVVDLDLEWRDAQWTIVDHKTRLARGDPGLAPQSSSPQLIKDAIIADHTATLAHIRQPIAMTQTPIHSYFTTIGIDIGQRVLAQAQLSHVAAALSDTPHADVPVLSATAPYLFGGRAGPGHYLDILPGPIALRDAAAIFPFADKLCAVRRNGKQIRHWIERSISRYNQLVPGQHNQTLLDPDNPGYNFDSLHGLTYKIDLSAPAMFDPSGNKTKPQGGRLRDLRHNGQLVDDDDIFIVATNRYRANGGGGFDPVPQDDLIFVSKESIRDILIRSLRNRSVIADTVPMNWSFVPLPDTSAIFESSPKARNHLTQAISHVGTGTDGFALYRFSF